MEQCEELINLPWRDEESSGDDRSGSFLEHVSADLERDLEQRIHFEELMDELRDWLSPGHYSEGDAIAGPDAALIGLQLLCKGRASAYGAKSVRVSQFSSDEVIWPTIPEDGRVVSVIADKYLRNQDGCARHSTLVGEPQGGTCLQAVSESAWRTFGHPAES